MKTQGRTLTCVNIYSCSINHRASQVGVQVFTRHVKYAFLDFETLLVIISSHFDKDQEGKLLDVLIEHKEALS